MGIDLPEIDLQLTCEAPELPDKDELSNWLAQASKAIGLEPGVEVSIRVVGDAESGALNHQFRGRDGATNVLSFPSDFRNLPGLPEDSDPCLGDIVLCAPVVQAEAEALGKSARAHWLHLVLHGFLHLNGYDHETEDEAREMESLETRLLQAKGFPDPYKEPDSS